MKKQIPQDIQNEYNEIKKIESEKNAISEDSVSSGNLLYFVENNTTQLNSISNTDVLDKKDARIVKELIHDNDISIFIHDIKIEE